MYAAVLNSHTLPIKCGTGFDLEHSELNTSLYRQNLNSARNKTLIIETKHKIFTYAFFSYSYFVFNN